MSDQPAEDAVNPLPPGMVHCAREVDPSIERIEIEQQKEGGG